MNALAAQLAAANQVDAAIAATLDALAPTAELDWKQPATDLTWSVNDTALHIVSCLVGYAGQIVGQPETGWVLPEFQEEPESTPAHVIGSVQGAGAILASVVRTASPENRGFHPYGTSDPEGFAAMGVLEALVHTYDIRLTAGQPWQLPTEPSAFAVRRLYRDAPEGDPAQVLLWCCGRIPLGELERRARWRWDGTPLP